MITLQERHRIAVAVARTHLLDDDLLEDARIQISASFDIMQHTTAERVEKIWFPQFLNQMQKLYDLQDRRLMDELVASLEMS